MIAKEFRLLWTVMRTEGAVAVLRRLAFRFFHVHSFSVLRLALHEGTPSPGPHPNVDFHEATIDEVQQLREGRTDLPEYFYRDRVERLGRCWVGLDRGQLGFIAWFGTPGSSGFVQVGDGQIEMAYVYNVESLRGKQVTTHALRLIAHALSRDGYRDLLIVTHAKNVPMNKACFACGFTKIGTIRRYAFVTWPCTPVNLTPWISAAGEQERVTPKRVAD